jgi:hypothetical protein
VSPPPGGSIAVGPDQSDPSKVRALPGRIGIPARGQIPRTASPSGHVVRSFRNVARDPYSACSFRARILTFNTYRVLAETSVVRADA